MTSGVRDAVWAGSWWVGADRARANPKALGSPSRLTSPLFREIHVFSIFFLSTTTTTTYINFFIIYDEI
jgi:hypothetical protein